MGREVYIAIALAVFAIWLLVRHVRSLIRGDGGGCGCCKGSCKPSGTDNQCPSTSESDDAPRE